MSVPIPDPAFPDDVSGFDSRDSEVVIVDGPGDTTVRPARPELLKHLIAEREKIAQYAQYLKLFPPTNQSQDVADAKQLDE